MTSPIIQCTNNELQSFSNEHINYEMDQLWFSTGLLQITGRYAGPGKSHIVNFLHNSLLDSFAVHARVLHDFFYRPPSGDDISVIHYVTDWKKIRPEKSVEMEMISKKANKQVAHLTYKRMEYENEPSKKGWKWTKIYSDFVDLFILMLENSDEDRLGKSFIKQIEFHKQRMLRRFRFQRIDDWEIDIRSP